MRKSCFLFLPLIALAACAQTPDGSMIAFSPPPGKSFEQFQIDQQYCENAAKNAVQGQAESQNHRALIGAGLATILGAGLGAAAGGGAGAGIGAAAGALAGGTGGAVYSDGRDNRIQTQYDNQYGACMTSRGNVQQSIGSQFYSPQQYNAYNASAMAPNPNAAYQGGGYQNGYPQGSAYQNYSQGGRSAPWSR